MLWRLLFKLVAIYISFHDDIISKPLTISQHFPNFTLSHFPFQIFDQKNPLSCFTFNILLADVDISKNPNPFHFWTAEYEYIKKTGIRIHFFKIEGIRESNYFQAQKSENTIIFKVAKFTNFQVTSFFMGISVFCRIGYNLVKQFLALFMLLATCVGQCQISMDRYYYTLLQKKCT